MTLRKFAVDYSKIKNDGPKVAAKSRLLEYAKVATVPPSVAVHYLIENAGRALESGRNSLAGPEFNLAPKVAALYNIHAAVELIRKLKKEKTTSGSTVKTPTVGWFRGYYAHFGLRMRCNATTKYYVELHLGAQGWQTWQMLLGLGYTPDQDAFWLGLDGFICAQEMPVATMADVSGDLFAGVA